MAELTCAEATINPIEWFEAKGFTFDDKITIKDVIDLQNDAGQRASVKVLIRKYKKLRARFYKKSVAATKRKDWDGQLIFCAYQMAYTEAQTDLEKLIGGVKLT